MYFVLIPACFVLTLLPFLRHSPFGEKYMNDNWDAKFKKKRMSLFARNDAPARVYGLYDGDGVWEKHFNKADMVIEAVPEHLPLKHAVMASIEPTLPEHAVFASNTSAIPIRDIASKRCVK